MRGGKILNIAVCDDEISVLNNETEMICDILDERAASYIIKKFKNYKPNCR